jgi:predicted small lipoprotein YifL
MTARRGWPLVWLLVALLLVALLLVALLLVALLSLAGCGATGAPSPTTFPPPGWTPSGEEQTFDTENLYDLVDGQADAFFAYAFERVSVRNYEDDTGAALRVEVWQLATPADAYGLFTTFRAGSPVAVGREGDGDPGRRLDFWQDRYLVRLFAPQPLDDGDLTAFARALETTLPPGGDRPVLLDNLPQDGRIERSDIFFHEEISFQSYVWLGGENLLGLSQQTDGILARYDLAGEMVYLLLVWYPDAAAATAALEALQAALPAPLAAAQVDGSLLGAVLGEADQAEAGALLDLALKAE